MKYPLAILSLCLFLVGCIGDDLISDTVEEKVVITNPIDSLTLNESHQFKANFLNQTGMSVDQFVDWSSSDPTVLSIDADGNATGLSIGMAEVIATVQRDGNSITARQSVIIAEVVTNPGGFTRKGALQTTSSYELTGDFTLTSEDGNITLELADNYVASAGLPGLYLYLTNNPGTTSGALEIGKVTVFSGAHSYDIPAEVEMNSYSHLLYFCKPFGVKVGDGIFDN